MFQKDLDISEFIKITNAGLEIANFSQILSGLTKRYKEIYGEDIDVSTGTADGVFLNNIALMMNNMLLSINTFYQNLDVNSASGIYLDRLCRLSNITRKTATQSTASINVTNSGTSTFSSNGLTVIDQGNVEWTYSKTLTIEPGDTKNIIVTCTSFGPIMAPAGWINRTVTATSLDVNQLVPCSLGSNAESDAELRGRRSKSISSQGYTVLEGLQGALLEIDGIEDIYIYNNNQQDSHTMPDGTVILGHAVYIILKQRDDVIIDESIIGTIIQNKLTPGIPTTKSLDTTHGVPTEYSFSVSAYGIQIDSFTQSVYWKKALPINPTITIQLSVLSYFTEDEIPEIAETVINYMNNLSVCKVVNTNELLSIILYADPQFKNQNTYQVVSVNVAEQTQYNTYYKYSTHSFNTEDNTVTITIQ